MRRRLAPILVVITTWGILNFALTTLPAGASSWGTYAARCSQWLGAIPKLDSYIIENNRDGNRTALTASFAALYLDGKHITACHSSPDAQVNSIARRWGAAIENAAAYGYRWATHESTTNLLAFVSAERTAKKYQNQFANRLAALGR